MYVYVHEINKLECETNDINVNMNKFIKIY